MFDFFKKKEPEVKLTKDPFPDYSEIEELTIIDIRDKEDIEYYGWLKNSVHIEFDDMFASKLMVLDKTKKYGIMDLKGVVPVLKKAEYIAKEVGLDAKMLRGGFFYITEVLNIKPDKKD